MRKTRHSAAAAAGGGGGERDDLSAAAPVCGEANACLLRLKNSVDDDDGAAAAGETVKESSHRRRSRGGAPSEEVSEDDYVQFGRGLERRKRKATVTPHKEQTSKAVIKDKKIQGMYTLNHSTCYLSGLVYHLFLLTQQSQCFSELADDADLLSQENEDLKRQLADSTKEIEDLKQQLAEKTKELDDLKNKVIGHLQIQNNELKDENEQYKKTAKASRSLRLCRYCNERTTHDYRNCPKRKSDEVDQDDEEESSS
uniref:Uncharacterized protein n=1 Tax=Leersia perrieri TaxID=77586 RepID=A0A0D9UWP8_9ORYZ